MVHLEPFYPCSSKLEQATHLSDQNVFLDLVILCLLLHICFIKAHIVVFLPCISALRLLFHITNTSEFIIFS